MTKFKLFSLSLAFCFTLNLFADSNNFDPFNEPPQVSANSYWEEYKEVVYTGLAIVAAIGIGQKLRGVLTPDQKLKALTIAAVGTAAAAVATGGSSTDGGGGGSCCNPVAQAACTACQVTTGHACCGNTADACTCEH